MKTGLFKTALALVLGVAWLSAFQPVESEPPDADCPGCVAGATPASLHFPALPPSTCGVLFNIYGVSGSCKLQEPEPGAPCVQKTGCFFWYQVLCQGECGNVVPALFSLGGTALPLWTPCGTNQNMGVLPCGQTIPATFLVYDVTSGATAVKTSILSCTGCEDS